MSCAPSCSGISRAMLAWQLSVGFCFAALLFCAVAFIARPANASDGYTIGAGGTTTINVYGVCRNVHNNNGSYSMYVATNSSGEWSNFVANPQNASLSTCVTPGSQTWSSAGSYSFTVPAFNTLTIQAWGAGGAGDVNGNSGTTGNAGGDSYVSGYLTAGGGKGTGSMTGGAGGGAFGGNVANTSGANGGNGGYPTPGTGGAGANGGAGGYVSTASAPGGGGSGLRSGGSQGGAAGGGGAYAASTFSSGQIGVGTVLSLTVGAGGTNSQSSYGGQFTYLLGAVGQVTISWN